MNFVAIDFETANAERGSACALGAAVVKDGMIVDRKYTLLNPHQPFQKFCTYIHGITEDAVKNSPDFADIYPGFYNMIDGNFFVAHNVSFDIAVFRACCEERGLEMPNITPFCSVDMARKAWPHLQHHKLNSLCSHFSLPLKHHNAAEDATACALIVLKCAQEFSVNNLFDLKEALDKKARIDAELMKEKEDEFIAQIESAKRELLMMSE